MVDAMSQARNGYLLLILTLAGCVSRPEKAVIQPAVPEFKPTGHGAYVPPKLEEIEYAEFGDDSTKVALRIRQEDLPYILETLGKAIHVQHADELKSEMGPGGFQLVFNLTDKNRLAIFGNVDHTGFTAAKVMTIRIKTLARCKLEKDLIEVMLRRIKTP